MTERKRLLRKIKALLDKTVASGCPVDEALAALNKAKELIEEHSVTDTELASIGASFYKAHQQSQRSTSPPPATPSSAQSTPSGLKRVLFIVVMLFLLAGVARTFNSKPSNTPPSPPAVASPPTSAAASPSPANPEPKKETTAPNPVLQQAVGESLTQNIGGEINVNWQTYKVFRVWDTDEATTPGAVRAHHVLAQAPSSAMRLDELMFDASGKAIRGVICDLYRTGYSKCADSNNEITDLGEALSVLYSNKVRNPPHEPSTPARDKFAAAADEYVSDHGECRAGYNPAPWINGLRCRRCPFDYQWDAQVQACRLGTSFRAEAPPDETRDVPPVLAKEASERLIPAALDLMMQGFSKFRGEADFLSIISNVYTKNVTYYGRVTPRQDVLEDKRKFMVKWPDRSYRIRPGSLTVTCALTRDTCKATGIVDFTVSSDARTIIGNAEFKYGMEIHGGGAFIASEDSKVLEQHYEIVSADGSTCPDGYEAILYHKAAELSCRSTCAPGYNWNPYYHTCK
jgi:hypothetical protein